MRLALCGDGADFGGTDHLLHNLHGAMHLLLCCPRLQGSSGASPRKLASRRDSNEGVKVFGMSGGPSQVEGFSVARIWQRRAGRRWRCWRLFLEREREREKGGAKGAGIPEAWIRDGIGTLGKRPGLQTKSSKEAEGRPSSVSVAVARWKWRRLCGRS